MKKEERELKVYYVILHNKTNIKTLDNKLLITTSFLQLSFFLFQWVIFFVTLLG